MARQLLTLVPSPLYRAVVFLKYSGMHGMQIAYYTDSSGETFDYHSVRVFGPYETPGKARAMVSREKTHAEKGYSRWCQHDPVTRGYTYFDVAEVQGVVESGTTAWGLHLG